MSDFPAHGQYSQQHWDHQIRILRGLPLIGLLFIRIYTYLYGLHPSNDCALHEQQICHVHITAIYIRCAETIKWDL